MLSFDIYLIFNAPEILDLYELIHGEMKSMSDIQKHVIVYVR